jgi:hypothetical protein
MKLEEVTKLLRLGRSNMAAMILWFGILACKSVIEGHFFLFVIFEINIIFSVCDALQFHAALNQIESADTDDEGAV